MRIAPSRPIAAVVLVAMTWSTLGPSLVLAQQMATPGSSGATTPGASGAAIASAGADSSSAADSSNARDVWRPRDLGHARSSSAADSAALARSAAVAGSSSAADSSAAAEPPLLPEPPAWFRLLVHQPGVVLRDGEPMLDLTGTSGRRPIPWTSFTIAVVEVPAGTHRVTLRPADPMAVPPYEGFVVAVEPGDTLTVRLGAPRVTSSPPGARVLLDGEDLGAAPVWIDPTRLPGHRVLVEMPGYQRRTVEGDTLLDLARASGAARFELEPLSPQPLVELAPPEADSWIGRNRGLALTGSMLLLGAGVAGGIYFKNKADDFFQDYEQTGNAAERDSWFNKAQQNDRASLVGWLVGEAAFFATFFLLIYQSPRGLVPNPEATPAPVEPVARSRAALSPIAPDGEPGVTIGFVHEF